MPKQLDAIFNPSEQWRPVEEGTYPAHVSSLSIREGINTKFIFEYDSVKSAVTKINQILNLQRSNVATTQKEIATDSLNDIKNLRNLNKDLQIYFERNGKTYTGGLDENNLKNRMNSYLKELPDSYVSENNDLKSLFAFAKYFQKNSRRKNINRNR